MAERILTLHQLSLRDTDPVALVVSFYGFIEALSRRRGHNPDAPPHLRKETATV